MAHVPNGFPRLRRICSASIQMYIYGLSGGGAGVVCHKTRRGMRRRRSSLSIGEIMCILCLYSITWINTIRRPRSRERRVRWITSLASNSVDVCNFYWRQVDDDVSLPIDLPPPNFDAIEKIEYLHWDGTELEMLQSEIELTRHYSRLQITSSWSSS